MRGYTRNPFKHEREHTRFPARALSLGLGTAAFATSAHWWAAHFQTQRKNIVNNTYLSVPTRKGFRQFFDSVMGKEYEVSNKWFSNFTIEDIYDFEAPAHQEQLIHKRIERFEKMLRDLDLEKTRELQKAQNAVNNTLNKILPIGVKGQHFESISHGIGSIDLSWDDRKHLRDNVKTTLDNAAKAIADDDSVTINNLFTHDSIRGKNHADLISKARVAAAFPDGDPHGMSQTDMEAMFDPAQYSTLSFDKLRAYADELERVLASERTFTDKIKQIGAVKSGLNLEDVQKARHMTSGEIKNYLYRFMETIENIYREREIDPTHGLKKLVSLNSLDYESSPFYENKHHLNAQATGKFFGMWAKEGSPQDLKNFWRDASSKRFLPDWVEGLFKSDVDVLKDIKQRALPSGALGEIMREIQTVASRDPNARIQIHGVDVFAKELEGATEFHFDISYKAMGGGTSQLTWKYLMPKHGLIQTSAIGALRIANLNARGDSVERLQLNNLKKNLVRWLVSGSKGFHRITHLEAQDRTNREVQESIKRIIQSKRIENPELGRNILDYFTIGTGKEALPADTLKGVYESIGELEKLRTEAPGSTENLQFVNVDWQEPRTGKIGDPHELKRVSILRIKRKADGKVVPKGHEDVTSIILEVQDDHVHIKEYGQDYENRLAENIKNKLANVRIQKFNPNDKESLYRVLTDELNKGGTVVTTGDPQRNFDRLLQDLEKHIRHKNPSAKLKDNKFYSLMQRFSVGRDNVRTIDAHVINRLAQEMDATAPNFKASYLETAIDKRLEQLSSMEYGKAKELIDHIYNRAFGMSRDEIISNKWHLLGHGLHRTVVNAVVGLLYADFDWNMNEAMPDSLYNALEFINYDKFSTDPEKLKSVLNINLASGQMAQHKRLAIPAKSIIPFWAARAQQRGYHQPFHGMPLYGKDGSFFEWRGYATDQKWRGLSGLLHKTPSKVGKLPSLIMEGTEDFWAGPMSNYYRTQTALFTNHSILEAGQSVWADTAYYGQEVAVEKPVKLLEGTAIVGRGVAVTPGDVLGKAPGDGLKPGDDIVATNYATVIDSKTENGITTLLLKSDPSKVVGTHFTSNFGKHSVTTLVQAKYMPRRIDSIMSYNPGDKGEIGGLLDMYVSRLRVYTEENPEVSKDVVRIFNEKFKGILSAYIDNTRGGSVQFTYGPHDFDPQFILKEDLFNRLGEVYRGLSIRTGEYSRLMEGKEPIDHKVKAIAEFNPKKWSDDAVRAFTSRLIEDTQKSEVYLQTWADFFKEKGIPTEEAVKAFREKIDIMREYLRDGRIGDLQDMIEAEEWNIGPMGLYHLSKGIFSAAGMAMPQNPIVAGIPAQTALTIVSDASQRGQGDLAKITELVIMQLEGRKGSEQLIDYLRKDVIWKQSAQRLGMPHLMAAVGKGMLVIPPDMKEYSVLLGIGEDIQSESKLQNIFAKSLMVRSAWTEERAEKIAREVAATNNIFEYGGQVVDLEGLKNILGPEFSPDNIEEYRLSIEDLKSQIRIRGSVEYMRNMKSGILRNLSGKTEFVFPGTQKQATVPVLAFTEPGLSMFDLRVGGEEVVVLGKEQSLLDNLIIHMEAADKSQQAAIIAQFLDLYASKNFKKNMYGYDPLSIQAFSQTAGFEYDTKDFFVNNEEALTRVFDQRVALENDVLINKKWLVEHKSDIIERITNMSTDDMEEMLKMNRNYLGSFGVELEGSPGVTSHPRMRIGAAKETLRISGVEFDNTSEFVDDMLKGGLHNLNKRQFAKLYYQGLERGALGAPGIIYKWPVYGTRQVQPVMQYFVDPAKMAFGTVKDAAAWVHPKIQSYLRLDTDGDTANNLVLPPGILRFMKSELGPFADTTGEEIMDISGGRAHGKGYLFYNVKKHRQEWKTPEEYKEFLDSKINKVMKEAEAVGVISGKHAQQGIGSLIQAQGATEYNTMVMAYMAENIKNAAGLAGMLQVNMQTILKERGIESPAIEEFMRGFTGLPEWGLKQKGLGTYLHPSFWVHMDIRALGMPAADHYDHLTTTPLDRLRALRNAAKQEKAASLIYPGTHYIRNAQGDPAKPFSVTIEHKDNLPGEWFAGKLRGSILDSFRDMGGTIDSPDKLDYLEQLTKVQPGVLSYGTHMYKLHSASASMRNIVELISSGKLDPNAVAPFLDPSGVTGSITYDEGIFQSMGKWINSTLGEKAAKDVQMAGSIMGGLAIGYLALNMFRPDQMRSLNMPGTGGEHFKYTFTQPQLNYRELMETPVGNPYDLPSVYLNLFGPEETSMFTRRALRSHDLSIPSRSELRGHRNAMGTSYVGSRHSHVQLFQR